MHPQLNLWVSLRQLTGTRADEIIADDVKYQYNTQTQQARGEAFRDSKRV
jgi:hypothetical protein